MSRAQNVTLLDVLWFEATHPRCKRCDEMTCELAGGCGCRLPRWATHRLVCGVELGVAR